METEKLEQDLIKVVGAVIFNEKRDAVLVGQRAQNTNYPLKYEFPGGKIEEGESPERAIAREIKEELGLEVEPQQILYVGFEDLENLGKATHQIFYIECRVKSDFQDTKLDSESHKIIEWVEIGKLVQLDLFEADLEFAKKLISSS